MEGGGGLAFFLEIGPLSLAVGQWGRGRWVGDAAPRDSSFAGRLRVGS